MAAWVVAVLLFAVLASANPNMLTSGGMFNLLNSGTALALASAGLALVVMSGGFDLSVGPLVALVNVIVATQMQGSVTRQVAAVLLAVAVGMLGGLVNGLLVSVLRLPSVIATLGTSFVWAGLAVWVLASPGGSVPLGFPEVVTGEHAGIPHSLVWLLLIVAGWLGLSRTRFRVHLIAMGSDEVAAEANRVPLRASLLQTYVTAGFLYGCSGVFLTAQTASGDPTLGGGFTLNAFAAVVVGGTAFGGGKGSAISGIVGAFILTMIIDILFYFGASSFYTYLVSGALLVVAVLLQGVGPLLKRAAGRTGGGRWMR